MVYVRNNFSNLQRALALGAVGIAVTAAPAVARPDYTLRRVAPAPAAPVVSSIDLRTPDAKDAADGRSLGSTNSLAGTASPSPQLVSNVEPVKAGDRFDWGSAGIGGGVVGVVTLTGLAGVAVTRRARMHPAR